MKNKLKKVVIALVVTVVVFIALCLIPASTPHERFLYRLDGFREDFEDGVCLQACSDVFFQLKHRHPTTLEFTQVVREHYNIYEALADQLSEETRANRTNVVSSLTGNGGWVYDTNTGLVAINLTNEVRLDDALSIVPSKVKFAPLPVYPGLDTYSQSGMRQCLDKTLPRLLEDATDNFTNQILHGQ